MDPFLFKYVDFLRIRAEGPKTLRTYIREKIFGELDRNGFSDSDTARYLRVTPVDIVNYRKGLLVLTENEINAIAWLKPEMFILNKIIPVRRLSRRDIEDIRGFLHSGGRESRPGGTTKRDLSIICDKPLPEEAEKPLEDYDTSQEFTQDPSYSRGSSESSQHSQTEIDKAEEGFMPGGIACYILAFLDKHPELDF